LIKILIVNFHYDLIVSNTMPMFSRLPRAATSHLSALE